MLHGSSRASGPRGGTSLNSSSSPAPGARRSYSDSQRCMPGTWPAPTTATTRAPPALEDALRQIPVALVDQHLLDPRQVVGEIVEHALQGAALLERLDLFAVQLIVRESRRQQRRKQLEPAPPASLAPRAAQRHLDLPVAQLEPNTRLLGGRHRRRHLRSRLHAEVHPQAPLERVQYDVGEHQEALALFEYAPNIEILPVPRAADGGVAASIELHAHAVRLRAGDGFAYFRHAAPICERYRSEVPNAHLVLPSQALVPRSGYPLP